MNAVKKLVSEPFQRSDTTNGQTPAPSPARNRSQSAHVTKKLAVGICALASALTLSCMTPVTVQAAKPSSCSAQEWQVLRLTNEKRMANGLDAISTFGDLQSACDVRAKELTQLFSHDRPDGTQCFTALDGINATSMGENIAAGQTSASSVITAWWNSPGHKANMLGDSFDHMGVGYYKRANSSYTHYWVQMFVGGCTSEKITVNGASSTKSYKKGTTINQMKRYLKVTCDTHGISYLPLSEKMCSGYKATKTGTQTIKVNYKGLQTSFKAKITK